MGLPDWAGQLPSFSFKHLAKHFPQARLATHSVRAATFEEAAKLLPAGQVDFVVIDTEGHERAIIETIDLNRHRVKFILYEHRHLPEPDRAAIVGRLRKKGFSLKAFAWDLVAWRSLD